eukprot:scaffold3568_cov108-Skeletonema_marinoi.AAC.5
MTHACWAVRQVRQRPRSCCCWMQTCGREIILTQQTWRWPKTRLYIQVYRVIKRWKYFRFRSVLTA